MSKESSEKQQAVLEQYYRSPFRFSTKQLQVLKKAYSSNPLPNHSLKLKLAQELNVDWIKVKVWFANKRRREKKMQFQEMNCSGK